MVDVVYNYPKSSCDCYDCGNKDYDDQTEGTPSNLSVLNCKVDKSFDCTNNKLFRSDIQPAAKRGTILINPQVITENFARDFEKAIPTDQCKGPQYSAYGDSRLVNAARAQITTLDHPPIDGSMKLHELADSKYLDNFGQNYKSYADINAGQFMYYNDTSIEDPYFGPNFITSAYTDGILYKDPMGAMKPQYTRIPVKNDNPIGPKRDQYDGQYSWMQDSLNHRQDLMSLQQRKSNQQRYVPRWTSLSPVES